MAGGGVRAGAAVLVKGAGEIGSAVAVRLLQAGHLPLLLEGPAPLTTRRRMALSDAVFDGTAGLEGALARRVEAAEVEGAFCRGEIPLVVGAAPPLGFAAVVDACMRKAAEPEVQIGEAPLVIGLGPGFVAGIHCHVVVETAHGPALGAILWRGSPTPYDATPQEIAGTRRERHVRADRAGRFLTALAIGDEVRAGEAVGEVEGVPQRAGIAGRLRGLLYHGVEVGRGARLAEVVPAAADVPVSGIAARPGRIADAVAGLVGAKGG